MPKLLSILILFVALLVLSLAFPGPANASRPLKIGVLDFAGEEHSTGHWQPTVEALNSALPEYRFSLVPLDLEGLGRELAAGHLDFVITNPGDYVTLEYQEHISRIATAEGDMPVASTLVAKSDLRHLKDLSGKRLAIVSTEAFGGFQAVWAEAQKRDPGLQDRIQLIVTGVPMRNAAEAVLEGDADAAVLRACMLERLKTSDPETFASLHAFALRPETPGGCAVSSPVYPGWPIAKAQKTSPALAKKVTIALLGMQAGNYWTVPLDYQPVHDVMRELRVGPYLRTGPVAISDVINDYRDWLIALGVALIFWAIYSVRIETLVRRRTQALNAANAGLKREMAERRRVEEADRQHRRELEHVARLSILGEMASSIAHELNQPLAAISGYAQGSLLRLRGGNCTPTDMERASEEISQQAERASTVIKRIRAFVRKRESSRTMVDFAALTGEAAALFAATTKRVGAETRINLQEGLPMVFADAIQIQQVVLNLVQNAVEAMETTAPEDRTIEIGLARESDPVLGDGICLSVRDHGQGLGQEGLAHFAEPFYTTKNEGIGLGLSLSRSIVEAHGGRLRAEIPTDGVGLRVKVWLPVKERE
ncbi:PhnD/SsuA/transferrin family substrate-binding protein [Thioclava sp. F28-4]|uniref:sensor histidine kinase n=1 Tax=Thioclava sp. F28-4 TaxID=1915315 RepID=UPI0009973FB8|nr:PhnD/SsuA/transferrin family substrate-binding protein [Thioclava sp. F28-4]OOY02879.1 hypothetical protein BMI87_20460 [Thioclava sp. F28-4]